jgi:hypothetical protein
MDPLSVTANIITVLQVCNSIISVCYNFRSVIKDIPWGLTKIQDEIRELRGILEALVGIAEALEVASPESARSFATLPLVCDTETGILATCFQELRSLENRLNPPCRDLSRTKVGALFQSIAWELKDTKTRAILAKLERYKATLSIAISMDETLELPFPCSRFGEPELIFTADAYFWKRGGRVNH